jgi:hypothetical protein
VALLRFSKVLCAKSIHQFISIGRMTPITK